MLCKNWVDSSDCYWLSWLWWRAPTGWQNLTGSRANGEPVDVGVGLHTWENKSVYVVDGRVHRLILSLHKMQLLSCTSYTFELSHLISLTSQKIWFKHPDYSSVHVCSHSQLSVMVFGMMCWLLNQKGHFHMWVLSSWKNLIAPIH